MLAKEEYERRSRKQSLNEGYEKTQSGGSGGPGKEFEGEFNKQMILVFDKEELRHRQKLQLYGNMKLLAELFTHSCINESIIVTCLDSLFEEIDD